MVEEALGNAAEAAAMIIQGKIDEAMNRFNRTKEAPKPDKEGKAKGTGIGAHAAAGRKKPRGTVNRKGTDVWTYSYSLYISSLILKK